MNQMTPMLEAIQRGDAKAAEDLLTLVYQELRRIAAMKMASEPSDHTLQPTALVHEVWLRLMGSGSPTFAGRAHFFSAVAEAMRRILIDSAKRRLAKPTDEVGEEDLESINIEESKETPAAELLAIHEALDELAKQDPSAADLVKLRYFVGMTMAEAASALDMPLRSAERLWNFARAWLRRRIGQR
jgi:RNA polymerase sigma factor (TIGR02999 family)